MSAQGTPFTTGWGYWPSSDIYSLDPLWNEWHTGQGITKSCTGEEAILQNIIADRGFDWEITVTLTDMGTDLESTVDDVPATGYVRTDSYIVKPWGWSKSLAFTAEPVMDTLDPLLWTGKVKLTLPATLHGQLGLHQPWSYQVTVVLDGGVSAPDFPVKVMAGYLVVRP